MTVLYLGQAVMQESAFSVLYPSDSMQIIEYGILLVKQLVADTFKLAAGQN